MAENLFRERNKDLNFEIYMDMERRILTALASTKPVAPVSFVEQTICYSAAPWTYSWWARAIRWLSEWPWFRNWFLPYPIECLVTAHQIHIDSTELIHPESAIGEVHEQIIRLRMNNLSPYCILIGRKRLRDAIQDLGAAYVFGLPSVTSGQNHISSTFILGIPAFSFPFFDPNTVIVVPSHDNPR